MIKMNVGGAENRVMGFMLKVCEYVAQLANVMIVDDCHRPDDVALSRFPLALDEVIPHYVANRLRAVGVSLASDAFVEFADQFLWYRDAKSDNIIHV